MADVASMGRYIRERRDAIGMSQEEFGFAVGRNQRWASRLETGIAKELPDPEVMVAIADALGCTLDDLMRAAGYPVGIPPEPPQTDAEVYTAVMHQVSMSGLPPKVKALIRQAIDLARDINESNGDGPDTH